jgi:anaerobic selenocysteine-containing dehydrogenase
MNESQKPRRDFLKIGAAAVTVIPLLSASRWADAATNATMRTSLKYQNKPEGDKSCSGCMQFVPGKTAKALGQCKAIAGDTEISPQGYCIAWAKKA